MSARVDCKWCHRYEAQAGQDGLCWECASAPIPVPLVTKVARTQEAVEGLAVTAEPSIAALAEILDDVRRFVQRYVVLTPDQAVAVALWVAHVYAFGAAITTPYLHVSSATMRSGKSRLLEVFDVLLGGRSRFTMNISPAALYRVIDANPGTAVLMDESDRTMNGNREKAEELFGLINSGYRRRGGYAIRMVGMGASMKPQEFATFSPKVIAGIGTLQDTLADRCIPIRMRRRLPTEHVERFHERDAASADPIRASLEVWANIDTIAALAAARPKLPLELHDRAQDAWEPLFAIADMAGEEYGARARAAAIALHGSGASYAEERLELLALGHVREAFEESGEEKLATAMILEALVHRDDGPWAEWWGEAVGNGKPLAAARRLGRLLEPFDVKPTKIRLGDRSVRGYERADLADAWERNLPVGTGTTGTSGTPLASDVPGVADVPVPTEAESIALIEEVFRAS